MYTKDAHHVSDALSRWVYPPAMEDGAATLHGTTAAALYTTQCDLALDNYDNFKSHLPVYHPRLAPVTTRSAVKPMTSSALPQALSSAQQSHQTKWDYAHDPTYQSVVHDITAGHPHRDYTYFKDTLTYKNCISVPHVHINDMISLWHDYSHPGNAKLLAMLQRKYTFPIPTLELTSAIAQYSAACQQCQVLKPKNIHHGTLDYIPVPPTIFTSLCMDFLSLDRCEDTFGQAYDFVFVSKCRLSGYTLAIPCLKAGLTAQKLAHLFLHNCLTITGLPNDILSDNDKLITSEFFQTLC